MPNSPVAVISSWVVNGSVGGRAALCAFEAFGFPVWLVPTVVLPWHPGHGPGTRIISPDTVSLLGDLTHTSALSAIGGILTGYFGSPEQVEAAAALVRAAKAANPACLYLCDPILGDAGRLYQPVPVLEAIRDRLIPLADIATPNRFELEFLTGRTASDNGDLNHAARSLGPAEVIVTSAFAPAAEAANLLVAGAEEDAMSHPAFPRAPHGTGDVLAAVYLAERLKGTSPRIAFGGAIAATVAVIGLGPGASELDLIGARQIFTGASASRGPS